MEDYFTPILEAFGASIGVEGLALDEHQSCTLAIDEVMLTMQWIEDSEVLLVYAPVGMIDNKVGDNRQLLQLLEANCLGQGTGGLTLGVQPEFGAIILSGQLPTQNLNPVGLERFMEFFTSMAEEWSRRLAETRPEEAPDTSGIPAGGILI
ncbi:MAG: type III secretion system chaperone [Deltaproteobacteria bacterium]|nr:type III secretion system chaperone [Deltaproteobacteria bacterium]